MTHHITCPNCNSVIPPDARAGLCPKCLIGLGFPLNGQSSGQSRFQSGDSFRSFGKYQLGPQLGIGGMGVVYEAAPESGGTIALKMIKDSLVYSPEARRRFSIEIDAARRLNHPNIVPVYEYGEFDEHLFFTMKLVDGKSLREHIAAGQFFPPQAAAQPESIIHDFPSRQRRAVQLVATLAHAVQHAHDKGVIHRDLKPANILIDNATGQPHLTDFGLAKLLDNAPGDPSLPTLTASQVALGTPPYMSPEQAAGQHLTKASDIYSLGAVFYELLTGQPPFKSETHLATIQAIISKPLRNPSMLNPAVDKYLDSICCKCLEKNPAARYSSAEALAEHLENWLAGRRPGGIRPLGPFIRTKRWVQRNPIGTSLILSLFIGMCTTSLFLKKALDSKHREQTHRGYYIIEMDKEIQRLWEDPTRSSVIIPSSQLAMLGNLNPRELNPKRPEYIFGVNINENPGASAAVFAPFLRLLENQMEKRLKTPVSFALRLYKPDSPAMIEDALKTNDTTHFIRVSPVAYVRAKQTINGSALVPIAEPVCNKRGVIFTSSNVGMTRLDQAKGQRLRIAFAHTNTMISFFAKVVLARTGFRASDFSLYTNLPLPDPSLRTNLYAHSLVLQMVLTNACDLGTAEYRHFARRQPKLLELASFPVWEDIHVASPLLNSNVVAACRQSLVAIQGENFTLTGVWKNGLRKSLAARKARKILEPLHGTKITGFTNITDSSLNFIRAHMTNEYARFEGLIP